MEEPTTSVFVPNTTVLNVTNVQKPTPQLAIAVVQFLFGAIGNILAIMFLIRTRRRHKWKPFFRLVGALALTDLLSNVLVFPVTMHSSASYYTFVFPPGLCEFMSFVWTYTFMASAMLVFSMSIDRFLAIAFPFVYNSTTKIRRVNIMISTAWTVSAFISLLHIFGLGSAKKFFPGSWCFFNFTGTDRLNRINTYIYSVLGMLVLICTLMLNIFVIAWIFKGQVQTKKKRGNIFAVILLVCLVAILAVTWSPLMYQMLKSASSANPKDGKSELLAVRLANINSIVNPWMYIILRRENFAAVYKFFTKKEFDLKSKSMSKSGRGSSSNDKIEKTVISSVL